MIIAGVVIVYAKTSGGKTVFLGSKNTDTPPSFWKKRRLVRSVCFDLRKVGFLALGLPIDPTLGCVGTCACSYLYFCTFFECSSSKEKEKELIHYLMTWYFVKHAIVVHRNNKNELGHNKNNILYFFLYPRWWWSRPPPLFDVDRLVFFGLLCRHHLRFADWA
jgi:hypothetical protein